MLLRRLRYLTTTKHKASVPASSPRFVWQALSSLGASSFTHITSKAFEKEIENENFSHSFHSIWVPDVSSYENDPKRKMKIEEWKTSFSSIVDILVVFAGEFVVARDLVGKFYCHFCFLTRLFFPTPIHRRFLS